MYMPTAKARVFERNVTIQKPATQSSTYLSQHASLAVDGNFNPFNPSCTKSDLHSWLAVDLVQHFLIRGVLIMTDRNAGQGNKQFYTFCKILLTHFNSI